MGLPAKSRQQQIEDYLAAIFYDPLLFVETAFDFAGLHDAKGRPMKGPTEQQKELFRAIKSEVSRGRAGRPHFSIRSGHGTGKSTSLAQLAIWFLLTRPQGLIPCTAPSAHQLQDVLWKEISRWLARLLPPFDSLLELTTDRLRFKNPKRDGLGEAIARTARKENPDALQGFHHADILYMVDEAPGVAEEIFQTAEGALTTAGAISIMAGNPTKTSGTFYRSHHEDRADWTCLHWSSLDSPLMDDKYAERMARKYGKESFVYKVRVLGEFPSGNPDALISLELVQAAAERDLPEEVWKGEPVLIGVDPARFGDDETGVCVRQGRKVHEVLGWGGLDNIQVAGRTADLARKWNAEQVFVDSNGVGAGVADSLRRLVQCTVVDVNVSERPSNTDDYANFRSELWWRAREWFETRAVQIPDDDVFMSELTTTNLENDDLHKIRVESKAKRKKRLGSDKGGSPDRADAFIMTLLWGTSPVNTTQAAAKLMPEWTEDF